MTTTPITREEEENDVLEWISPGGELPTEFSAPSSEDGSDTDLELKPEPELKVETEVETGSEVLSTLDDGKDLGKWLAEGTLDNALDVGAAFGTRLLQGFNNNLKDILFQPNTLLGATPLDPDDYPRDKYPNLYTTRNKTVINEQGEEVLVPLMKPDGSYMFDSNNQLMYEKEFIGPLRPQIGLGGYNYDTISLFGKNPLFGIQLGEARKPDETGKYPDYGFLLSDKALPKREDISPVAEMTGELAAFAFMFWVGNRLMGKKGAKLNFPFTKKAEALISKGGFSNILKGRLLRGSTEGIASGYFSQRTLGQPGEGDVPMILSDALINIGDQMNIDLRNPLTNYFSSENTANDPFWKARLRSDLGDFTQAPFIAIGFEGIGAVKTKSLTSLKNAYIKQEDKFIEGLQQNKVVNLLVDLISIEKAQKDVDKAIELQQKGPEIEVKAEEVKDELVIPTERITGNQKPEPTVKEVIVEPKATQEELDLQVKKAEQELNLANKNADNSANEIQKPIKRRLSDKMQEDIDAVKGSIDQALDTAHRQTQTHLRRIKLEGVETNLINKTNADEYPSKATRTQIKDHIADLDTEFTTRSNDLGKRNRQNDEKYGKGNWPKEVREKWNSDWEDRQAVIQRKELFEQSIRDHDAGTQSQSSPEDVIKLGGLQKEAADEARFREFLKDPGDPELKELFDEIEEMNARHDANLKKAQNAFDRLGELLDIKDDLEAEMDELDKTLYGDKDITETQRDQLENIYQGLDAKRQEVKSNIEEVEAKEVKGIDTVVNEEQFKKYFQDLPVEKQRALLDELRNQGAITSNPTKIGDTPPPTDAVKSKTKFKPGSLAESMQSLIDDIKASDERSQKLMEGTIQIAKDALDLADGKMPRREGPIVDIEATVIDDEAVLPTKFYHGAADKFTLDDSGHYNRLSSYGYGLYTTDNVKVASGYKKKNRGDVKGEGQPTVYEIQEIKPVKFFDMEGEWTDELTNIFGKWTEENDSPYSQLLEEVLFYLKEGQGEKYFVPGTDKLNVRGVLEMLWEINQREDIVRPHYEVGEMISDIQEYLMTKGYGGWSHIGGMGPVSPGKDTHLVKIYWEPKEQVKIVPTNEAVNPGILPAVKDNAVSKKLRQASAKSRQLNKQLRSGEFNNNIFAPTELPVAPSDLRATINRYKSIRYRHDRVSFESDLDMAIYTITSKNRSKAHNRLVEWIEQDLGIDESIYTVISNNIKKQIQANKKKSPSAIATIKDSGVWKRGGDASLMMGDMKSLNTEEVANLKKLIEERRKKIKGEYDERIDPKDPGDALDPDAKLMTELPRLPDKPEGGRLGSNYLNPDGTVNSKLTKKQEAQLLIKMLKAAGITPKQWKGMMELGNVSGSKFRLEPGELKATIGPSQAKDYGLSDEWIGRRVSIGGMYDQINDILIVAMMHNGNLRTFDQILGTKFHEGFHALQQRFLTKAEHKALLDGETELRELAARLHPSMADDFLSGKIDSDEVQAFAFMGWLQHRDDYLKTGWAGVFDKLRRIIQSVSIFLRRDAGLTRWDDVFEDALTHKIRRRGELPIELQRGPNKNTMPDPMDDVLRDLEDMGPLKFQIDPEELANAMGKYKEGIDSGEIDIEEAMKSETRRLISRSGKTEYISRDSKDIIAMNATMEEALRAAFGDRADVTGMPSYKVEELFKKARSQVEADGYEVNTTILNYEHALKGDFQSMDDLYAAAGLLHHREVNLERLGIAAIEWDSAADDAAGAIAGKNLIAAMEDQLKLDIAWQSLTRKSAQTLKIAQTTHEDAVAAAFPHGTEVKQTVSKEIAEKAVKEGIEPQKGVLGEGAYFSTESTPGVKGAVELFGRTLSDVEILDLTVNARQIPDLLKDLNLGKPKKTKSGLQLTPSQQAGVREWAERQGYGGIRYGTDQGQDQIIIYDLNTANRMIDSEAATPPPKQEGEGARTLLENSINQTENILEKRLPPEVRESIQKGELTAEVREILDGMTSIAYHLNNTPGAKAAFSDLIESIPQGQLDANVLANLFRNMIFFSVRTWGKVLFGTGYRAATLPLTQIFGATHSQIKAFADGDPQALRLASRRQKLNLMMYPKYIQQLPYAIRMTVASFRHNETLVNMGRSQSEITARKGFSSSDQLELDMMGNRLRENPTGEEWWLDGDSNPVALFARAAWDGFRTTSGRVMGSFDTFFAAMIGPTSEWARLMEQELFNADIKGFEPGSEEAWKFASDKTNRLLKSHMQDLDMANGEVIKDGRLVSPYAKKAMDWVNFTDDVWVPTNEAKTIQYGVRAAKESGLTDAREILEYATQWTKQEVEDTEFRKFLESVINAPGVGTRHMYAKNIWTQTTMAMIRPTNRTPSNLIKSTLRMIPGVNNTVDTYWRDINSEDFFTRERALGEVGTGITTLTFGVMMARSGLVEFTGPPSVVPAERYERDRAGWQPWSIRFRMPGGDWSPYYDLTMFDQLANVFGAVGAYVENVTSMSEEDADGLAGVSALAIAKTVGQMTVGQFTKTALGGFTDLFDLLTEFSRERTPAAGSRWPVERYVTQRLAGFWPAFSNAARNAVDPVRRRPQEGNLGMIENLLKTIATRTPGLSATQPAYLHPITGIPISSNNVPGNQLIPKDEPWLAILHDTTVPWGVTKSKLLSSDPIDVEMLRLNGRGGTFQIWNRRTFNLKDRVLNSQELNRLITIGTTEVKLQKYGGRTLHQALLELIESPQYQSYDQAREEGLRTKSQIDKTKIKAINAVIDDYKNGVRVNGDIVELGAKQLFIEEMDTGDGSLGELIKIQEKDNIQINYDSQYGIPVQQSSLQSWQQLAS